MSVILRPLGEEFRFTLVWALTEPRVAWNRGPSVAAAAARRSIVRRLNLLSLGLLVMNMGPSKVLLNVLSDLDLHKPLVPGLKIGPRLWEEPAAAPRPTAASVFQDGSECQSEHPLQSPVIAVPVAEAIAGGAWEPTEYLRAGQVNHGVSGVQPARFRKQVVGVHPHGQLIFFPVSPGFRDGVLRPPHSSHAADAVSGIAWRKWRRIRERIDVEEGVLRRLRPHVRADGIIRDVDGLARHNTGRISLASQILVRTPCECEAGGQAPAEALNGQEGPAPNQLIQDAATIQETPALANGQFIIRLRNKLERLVVRSDCLGQPPVIELPAGGGASPKILAICEQEVIGEPRVEPPLQTRNHCMVGAVAVIAELVDTSKLLT